MSNSEAYKSPPQKLRRTSGFPPSAPESQSARERVFLVGLDYRVRTPGRGPTDETSPQQQKRVGTGMLTSAARQARDAVLRPAGLARAERACPVHGGRIVGGAARAGNQRGRGSGGRVLQRRDPPDPATLIGRGKVEEIAGAAASASASVVIFDHDLRPRSSATSRTLAPARVIDRTQLILDIFARHARTREGQLQVELAQLEYLLPRLAGRGREMSQLGGGIGTRGPGETQLETDRRKIYRRIRHIERATGGGAPHPRPAAPTARVGAGGHDGAGRLHQCGQIHAASTR